MEIIGTVSDTLIAGRLEICVGGRWHAVYDKGWGPLDVRVLCADRGFPSQGIKKYLHHSSQIILYTDAVSCKSSCLGSSSLSTGYSDFVCINASHFVNCGKKLVNGRLPEQNAGIICSKSSTYT